MVWSALGCEAGNDGTAGSAAQDKDGGVHGLGEPCLRWTETCLAPDPSTQLHLVRAQKQWRDSPAPKLRIALSHVTEHSYGDICLSLFCKCEFLNFIQKMIPWPTIIKLSRNTGSSTLTPSSTGVGGGRGIYHGWFPSQPCVARGPGWAAGRTGRESDQGVGHAIAARRKGRALSNQLPFG